MQVITKTDDMGHRLEPFEEAVTEVPEEFVGSVCTLLGSRRGQMRDMTTSEQGLSRVTYVIPTRSHITSGHRLWDRLLHPRGESVEPAGVNGNCFYGTALQ